MFFLLHTGYGRTLMTSDAATLHHHSPVHLPASSGTGTVFQQPTPVRPREPPSQPPQSQHHQPAAQAEQRTASAQHGGSLCVHTPPPPLTKADLQGPPGTTIRKPPRRPPIPNQTAPRPPARGRRISEPRADPLVPEYAAATRLHVQSQTCPRQPSRFFGVSPDPGP